MKIEFNKRKANYKRSTSYLLDLILHATGGYDMIEEQKNVDQFLQDIVSLAVEEVKKEYKKHGLR